jgi:transcriptional regulator with XRE-family HTH domain
MAKLKRDTTGYTPFGLLLDELCKKKKMSFRKLAVESGMSLESHTTITRACRGESTPKRENILAWSRVLDATADERKSLLKAFHYTDDE